MACCEWNTRHRPYNTPNKILAPTGYYIPSDTEWTTLVTFLGGETVAGGTMKSTGTTLWTSPNLGASNSSGFTGFPGGFRDYDGTFSNIGNVGGWWSSQNAYSRDLNYNSVSAYINTYGQEVGFSVRCLKDSPLSNAIFETNSLKLYPNPVVNILNIKTDSNLIYQTFTIMDGLGRVVINGKLNEVESTINVEQLSKGIYYLKVSGNRATKFIKE